MLPKIFNRMIMKYQ